MEKRRFIFVTGAAIMMQAREDGSAKVSREGGQVVVEHRAPGFFDVQVNGFAGVDFNDPAVSPEAVSRALDAMRATGVTRCLPTLITSSSEDFARCARAVLGSGHPAVAGLHMEGPYISSTDGPRGAHPRDHVREASVDDFARRQDAAAGRIRLVTLAPEFPAPCA